MPGALLGPVKRPIYAHQPTFFSSTSCVQQRVLESVVRVMHDEKKISNYSAWAVCTCSQFIDIVAGWLLLAHITRRWR